MTLPSWVLIQGWRPHNLQSASVWLLWAKKIFLTFKWNFLYFNLCPLSLASPQNTTEKSLAHSLHMLSWGVCACWDCPLQPFLLSPDQHHLSQPLISDAPVPLSLHPLAGFTVVIRLPAPASFQAFDTWRSQRRWSQSIVTSSVVLCADPLPPFPHLVT